MDINEFVKIQVSRYLNENELIEEGVSDIGYHFTSSNGLINIFKNDIFLLSPALSDGDKPLNRGRLYFMSTTRSRSSGFNSGNVKLVLDTKKLSEKYKIIPVKYFPNIRSSEQEDRVLSNKRILPNAISYIKEIHILNIKGVDSYLKEIFFYCIKYQIPFYLYENTDDFLNQKTPLDYHTYEHLLPNDEEYFDGTLSSEKNTLDEDLSCITKTYHGVNDLVALLCINNDDNYWKIMAYLKENSKSDDAYMSYIERIESTIDKIHIYNLDNFGDFVYRTFGTYRATILCKKFEMFLFNLLDKEIKINKIKNIEDYISFKFEAIRN